MYCLRFLRLIACSSGACNNFFRNATPGTVLTNMSIRSMFPVPDAGRSVCEGNSRKHQLYATVSYFDLHDCLKHVYCTGCTEYCMIHFCTKSGPWRQMHGMLTESLCNQKTREYGAFEIWDLLVVKTISTVLLRLLPLGSQLF